MSAPLSTHGSFRSHFFHDGRVGKGWVIHRIFPWRRSPQLGRVRWRRPCTWVSLPRVSRCTNSSSASSRPGCVSTPRLRTGTRCSHPIRRPAVGRGRRRRRDAPGWSGRRLRGPCRGRRPANRPVAFPGRSRRSLRRSPPAGSSMGSIDVVRSGLAGVSAGEGGAFRRWQEVSLAPTCRSCLRVGKRLGVSSCSPPSSPRRSKRSARGVYPALFLGRVHG